MSDLEVMKQAFDALQRAKNQVVQLGRLCEVVPDTKKISDAIEALRAALAEPVPHGCHIDLEPDQEPDGCVLDENRPHLCIHAQSLYGDGKDKTECEYWKPIEVKR